MVKGEIEVIVGLISQTYVSLLRMLVWMNNG